MREVEEATDALVAYKKYPFEFTEVTNMHSDNHGMFTKVIRAKFRNVVWVNLWFIRMRFMWMTEGPYQSEY